MTIVFRYRKLLVLCAAMGLAVIAPLLASGGRADVAMLKKIASRVTDRTGIITIEASDPVPYVASQPDPNTFVVELRDVVALGFADGRHRRSPLGGVGRARAERSGV